MCGATSAQTQLQTEQAQAYQDAQNMMQQMYADQGAIYSQMRDQFSSIFAAGPSQVGFSPAETQNLETGVIEGTGANYANAAKAVGEQLAAQGGAGYMPSGAADQLRLQTALSSAQEKSSEEQQITAANYAQGRQNWQQAATGLLDIAAGQNPLGYEQGATGAGTAAANTANQIAQEQNSWINAALGAAGSIGGAVVNQNPGDIFG